MVEFLEGLVNVAVHGDVDMLFVAVPIKVETALRFAFSQSTVRAQLALIGLMRCNKRHHLWRNA